MGGGLHKVSDNAVNFLRIEVFSVVINLQNTRVKREEDELKREYFSHCVNRPS